MNLPRAILFDHDGVLVASEALHEAAWKRLSAELGVPFDEALVRDAVGKTAPQVVTLLLAKFRPDWSGDAERIRRLVERKNEIYLEEGRRGLQPYPGVIAGLEWLKERGIGAAVVSNARRRELRAMLDQTGLTPWFQAIISREDASAPKPDPAPYLLAAASLGAAPGECIAVEDSPPGLQAALVAGVPAATVLTNFPRSVLEAPVPGRPDLRPFWIGPDMTGFFAMLAGLKPAPAPNLSPPQA